MNGEVRTSHLWKKKSEIPFRGSSVSEFISTPAPSSRPFHAFSSVSPEFFPQVPALGAEMPAPASKNIKGCLSLTQAAGIEGPWTILEPSGMSTAAWIMLKLIRL